MRDELSKVDVRRLALEAHRDARTVRAVAEGRPGVTANSIASVEAAARRLGIELPGRVATAKAG